MAIRTSRGGRNRLASGADRIQNKHEAMALETAIQNAMSCANMTGSPREVVQRIVEAAALATRMFA
jgi:hypothetical protein